MSYILSYIKCGLYTTLPHIFCKFILCSKVMLTEDTVIFQSNTEYESLEYTENCGRPAAV